MLLKLDPAEQLRYNIALDIERKSTKEKKSHICVMLTSLKLLRYGGYLSNEEADKIQNRITEAIQKYDLKIDIEDVNRTRIIHLPFE